jgi:hypothetical protein
VWYYNMTCTFTELDAFIESALMLDSKEKRLQFLKAYNAFREAELNDKAIQNFRHASSGMSRKIPPKLANSVSNRAPPGGAGIASQPGTLRNLAGH